MEPSPQNLPENLDTEFVEEESLEASAGETDAEFEILISDDEMQASLHFQPARGGKAVTKDQILNAMTKQGISFGIKENLLDEMLQKNDTQECIIAEGEPAVDGKNGSFEKLLEDIRDRRPRIDDDGRAHYNDITHFTTVQPGEALIKRLTPTEGDAGQNIRGEIIPPTPGEAVMFASGIIGAKLSDEDPNILIACIYGQPVFIENGAMVEATITVENVDQSTGNIEFEGSVMIEGNVTTGMKIDAAGDVIINGMVEEATSINTGGDIIIQNGVIGRGSVFDEEGKPGKGIVRLQAMGSISAKFIENALVIAEKNINVNELIAHSDVTAKNTVTVGSKNAKRGHIMGGITRAENSIQAEVLGSQAAVNTKIIVGVNPEYTSALKNTNQQLETKKAEQEKIQLILSRALKQQAKNRKEILTRLKTTLNQLSDDINKINKLKEQHKERVDHLKKAKIIVNRKAFNCVEVTVANFQEKLAEEKSGGTYMIREGDFTFEFR